MAASSAALTADCGTSPLPSSCGIKKSSATTLFGRASGLLAPRALCKRPTHMSEDDAAAAAQELEALQAIYGDDAGDAPVRLEIASPSEWRFRLGADAILEVFVPRDYPSLQAPTPVLHAPRLGDRASALVDQLLELYEGAEARHMHTNGLTLKHSTALSYVSPRPRRRWCLRGSSCCDRSSPLSRRRWRQMRRRRRRRRWRRRRRRRRWL